MTDRTVQVKPRTSLAIALTGVLLTVGCTQNGANDVDSALSQEQAQNRTVEVLGRSLSVLPTGTRLDVENPTYPQSDLSRGGFGPCYNDNTIDYGPHQFSAGYWVVSDGAHRGNLEVLVASWGEWGWTIEDDSKDGGKTARATTPDGYRIAAELGTPEYLSVTGVSPCFAIETGQTPPRAVAPPVIEQR